jgi:hypothetical protein
LFCEAAGVAIGAEGLASLVGAVVLVPMDELLPEVEELDEPMVEEPIAEELVLEGLMAEPEVVDELVSGVLEVLGVLVVLGVVAGAVVVSSFLPQAPRASNAERASAVAVAVLNLDAYMSVFPFG